MKANKKKIGFGLSLFIAILFIATFLSYRTEKYPKKIINLGSEEKIKLFPLFDKKYWLNIPTISPVDKDNFLVADFKNIYRLNLQNAQISLVSVDDKILTKFQPTGVYYDKDSSYVFVANYLHNNIMVFDFHANKLVWLETITHPKLISPEGIWFDSKSKIITVANFDGHSVMAFRFAKPSSKFLWEQKVDYAHGITVFDGKVYVTGLLTREIYEFEIEQGKMLRKVGSIGWGSGEYLWPTSIYSDGMGQLIVSDAESGFITVLNASTLKVIDVYGGNGPGWSYFSQPYVTVVEHGKFITVSTKQERIVVGEYPNFRAEKSFLFNVDGWQLLGNRKPDRFGGPEGWSGYRNLDGKKLRILGREFETESTVLVSPDGNMPVILTTGSYSLFGYTQWKQLLIDQHGADQFLLSPYSPQGPLLVRIIGDRIYSARFNGENNCWFAMESVICQNSSTLLSSFSETADEFFGMIDSLRCDSGLVPYEKFSKTLLDFRKKYRINDVDLDIDRDIGSSFASKNAKIFFEAWRDVSDCNDDVNEVKILAENYFKQLKGQKLSIDELSAVSMTMPK